MCFRTIHIALLAWLFAGLGCLPVHSQQHATIDIVTIAEEAIMADDWLQADSIMAKHGMEHSELGFTADFRFYEAQQDSAWYAAQVYPAKGRKQRVGKIEFFSNHNADGVVSALLSHGYQYEGYHPVTTTVSGWYSRGNIKVNFVLFPKDGSRYEVTFYLNGLSSK